MPIVDVAMPLSEPTPNPPIRLDEDRQVHSTFSAAARAAESRAAATLPGAQLIHADLPDTVLSAGPISVIERAIAQVGPSIVSTHTLRDNHQDHRAAHRAAVVAARGVPNLLCYQAPSTAIDFTPTHFIDVTAFIDAKIRALQALASQYAVRPYLAGDLTLATTRYWSRFAGGKGFVEPMEVIRTIAAARPASLCCERSRRAPACSSSGPTATRTRRGRTSPPPALLAQMQAAAS
jgi:hypothetical protein